MPELNQIVTGIAVYFILWWLLLFTVLPWRIKSQHEGDEVIKGTEPGAPVDPQLKRKAIITTIIAAIVWIIIFTIIKFNLIKIDDIPFIPDFVPKDF